MLTSLRSGDIVDAIENNCEPFFNETGPGTALLGPADEARGPTFETDYVLDDDYGRVWSTDFYRRHTGLLSGPPHPELASFANHGYLAVPFRTVPRRRVESKVELYRSLAELTAATKRLYPQRVVLYRGQTKEHALVREKAERIRLFGTVDLVEPSLRPSDTRRPPLGDVASVVWSHLVQRHLGRTGEYAPAHGFVETGEAWHHATANGRLVNLAFAQHYGLPTPALDVTNDIDVGLWFATHDLIGSLGRACCVVPAAGGDGVVYVIAGDHTQYFDAGLTKEAALRPLRQHGGFLVSNWGNSKNRVVRYLTGAVYFPHSLSSEFEDQLPTGAELFPGPDEDQFVGLIQRLARVNLSTAHALSEIATHVYWVSSSGASESTVHGPSLPLPAAIPTASDDGGPLRATTAGAAESEHMRSLYERGVEYDVAGNPAAAEEQWRSAALGGHVEAAAAYGALLSDRDDPDGEQWLKWAADLGSVNAMNDLGSVVAARGALDEAEMWYRTAAEAGFEIAAYNLGVLLTRVGRKPEAERWLTMAAEAGDGDAACRLGKLLCDRGDRASGERWFGAGARTGHVEASYNLGLILEGRGEFPAAADLFRHAAAAGDPDARYRLARLKARGGEVC